MEFFSHESCGKCTLCREGNHQILRLLEKLHAGQGDKHDLEMMEVISKAMQDVSLCGLGMASTTPLVSSLKYFKSDLEKYIN